jgi:hypothetical protein
MLRAASEKGIALTTVGSAVEIEYLERRLKARVASGPLLDPAMARLKA